MYSFTSELKLSEFYRRLTSKNESTLEIRITDLIQRKNLVESEINLFNSGLSEFEDAEQKFHAPPDSSTLFWTWEKPAEFLHGLSAIVDFRFRISIIAEGNRTEKIPEKLFGLINREILLHPPVSKPKAETKKTDTLPKKRKKK